MAQCHGRTAGGQPCHRPARKNLDFCPAHDPDPDVRAACHAAQSKGGQHKKTTAPTASPLSINPKTLEGLDAFLVAQMENLSQVQSSDVDTINAHCNRFNAYCNGARVLLQIREGTVVRAELADLVRRVEAPPDESTVAVGLESLLQSERDYRDERHKRDLIRLSAVSASLTATEEHGSAPNRTKGGAQDQLSNEQRDSDPGSNSADEKR